MSAADRQLDGRIVLVTGASRGLGRASAIALASRGAKLILIARTRGGLEETDDLARAAGMAEPATLITLDLRKGDLVDKLGAALHERFGRLDGLVACAADLGPLTPVHHLEPREFERIMTINAFANQRLVRTLDPLFRQSKGARLVLVTDRHAQAQAFWGAYAASKAALEAFARAYGAENRKFGIKVDLFDPGPMATALRAKAFPGERAGAQPDPGEAAARLVALFDERDPDQPRAC